MSITVSQLTLYPIKSCGGVTVQAAALTDTGFAGDRQLMVTTAAGQFVTQRLYPRMALIAPSLDGDRLTLSAPGMQPQRVTVDRSGTPQPVAVWGDSCLAVDQGKMVAEWISDYLHAELRLVALHADFKRQIADQNAVVSFADGYPLLLLSEASLAELNARLPQPVDSRRFRPNIVVDGCAAHAEDRWQQFSIGQIALQSAGPCARCVVPTIDPDSGEKGVEPNRTLATYRRDNGNIYFGINVIQRSAGTIAVGDRVTLAAPNEVN